MTSTFSASCTGFVPESITGGETAGQGSGDRYKSRFDMNRTMGNADQGQVGADSPDLQELWSRRVKTGRSGPRWLVPDFYRARRRPLGQRLTDQQAVTR